MSVIVGDAAEAVSTLAPGSVDLAVFSPPYDNLRQYKGAPPWDRMALGRALFNAIKEGGVCAVVINDQTVDRAKTLTSFSLAVDWCREIGWRLFECCIYHRHGKPGDLWRKRFRVDHEYIMLFLKGSTPRVFDKQHLMVPCKNAGKVQIAFSSRDADGTTRGRRNVVIQSEKCRGTVWTYKKKSSSEGNRLKLQHPATFPDALAMDLILAFSKPGDLVLDPMAGSGTTLVAAAKAGRRWMGVEIAAEYADLARRRIKAEVDLFGEGR